MIISIDKKSVIKRILKLISFLFDKKNEEIKLKNKIITKKTSLKSEFSKILKFKVLKISFVSSPWNSKGAIITEEPLKKYRISLKKIYLSTKNTVSSLPK